MSIEIIRITEQPLQLIGQCTGACPGTPGIMYGGESSMDYWIGSMSPTRQSGTL